MATLKISDLSVGDWVEFEGEPSRVLECGTIVVSPKTLEFKPRLILSQKLDIYDCVDVDKVNPIPITPEILEANGWEKDGRSYKWSNEKHRVFVWLKEFSHFVDVVEMDKQFATKNSCIEVSQLFVHQFQHALRLAGVDKEIVMPKK